MLKVKPKTELKEEEIKDGNITKQIKKENRFPFAYVNIQPFL